MCLIFLALKPSHRWVDQAALRMVQMQWDDVEEILQEVLNDDPSHQGCDSNSPEALLLQAQLLLRRSVKIRLARTGSKPSLLPCDSSCQFFN